MKPLSFYFRRVRVLAAAALLVLSQAPVHANPVTAWDEVALDVMLAEKTNVLAQNRVMAMMHSAIFDAVNAVERRYTPYRTDIAAAPGTSAEAAAAAAAHAILSALYPAQRPVLDQHYRAALDAVAENPGKASGIELGHGVAAAVLEWRSGDGVDAKVDYTPGSGAGAWIPTGEGPPIAPHWGNITPWFITGVTEFRPEPPPALDSDAYRRDYEEVKTVGSKDSTTRSSEQTDVARFWMQGGVPGWNPTARQLAAHKGLDLVDSARLFALLGMASADAIIACYAAKYHYNFWRPVTAFQYDAVQNWEPAIPTPMFPAYPSGHACFGGAAAAVLEAEFGAGELPIEVVATSAAAPGVERRYRSLQQQLDDVSNGRVWGGIHWRFDQTVGEALGRAVGERTVATLLRPRAS